MKRKDARQPNGSNRRWWKWGLAAVCIVAAATVAIRYLWQTPDVNAQAPPSRASAAADGQAAPRRQPQRKAEYIPEVVAVVNGERIDKNALGAVCLARYGKEVLESLVNKHLISHHCKKHNVSVSDQEIDEEIKRMAARFNISVDQWIKLLETERDITLAQYRRDILWPTLALRKLAGRRLEPDPEELRRAYIAQYGEGVQVRVIVLRNAEKAREVQQMAAADPGNFPRLAIEYSEDADSASQGGLIPPIRRYKGDPRVEDAAFALRDGQVSEVIPALGNHFFVLKREAAVPASKVRFDEVKDQMAQGMREKKLTQMAHDIFRQLQQETQVVVVYGDPQKRDHYPGVAAFVDDHKVTLQDLAAECVLRHGKETLQLVIDRKLVEQACRKKQIGVRQEDIHAELAHNAELFGVVDEQGRPQIDKWLAQVTAEQEMSEQYYVDHIVWPTVALKKMVAGTFEVTDEHMQRAYVANYGERVRCRWIVFNNQRQAREVWDMVRRDPSPENFGRLAKQYSADPTSRELEGEIPPIERFGGREQLEEAAFALGPGEISPVLQMADKFVILLCEGRTKPVEVNIDEVRPYLEKDIFEKLEAREMAAHFSKLKESAQIDNFLAGTTQNPAGAPVETGGPGPRVGTRNSPPTKR